MILICLYWYEWLASQADSWARCCADVLLVSMRQSSTSVGVRVRDEYETRARRFAEEYELAEWRARAFVHETREIVNAGGGA